MIGVLKAVIILSAFFLFLRVWRTGRWPGTVNVAVVIVMLTALATGAIR